jgi:hypothetical protein
MKKILFIEWALGMVMFLETIALLFTPHSKDRRRSSSSLKDATYNNKEEGLERDKQILLGDWQNIVGDFNNAFNKIA